MSDSLWPHGLQHTRLPCPSLTPGDQTSPKPMVFPMKSHLVSGPNEIQALDVSSQKEFNDNQSGRWEVNLFRGTLHRQSVGHCREWVQPWNVVWLALRAGKFHMLLIINKSLKCSTWLQSQKQQDDPCSFPRQTIQ